MLRWCYVLLISNIYASQARYIIDDICRIKSTAPIPDRCILKCMQILYDNECCSICENDIDFWEKLMDNKHTLLEKSKMEFCLVCENGSANAHQFYGNITNFFEAANSNWCIGVFDSKKTVNSNPIVNCSNKDMNKQLRMKRSVRLFPRSSSDNSYSITYSNANLIMGSIFVGAIVVFVLICICRALSEFLDPPNEEYSVNS